MLNVSVLILTCALLYDCVLGFPVTVLPVNVTSVGGVAGLANQTNSQLTDALARGDTNAVSQLLLSVTTVLGNTTSNDTSAIQALRGSLLSAVTGITDKSFSTSATTIQSVWTCARHLIMNPSRPHIDMRIAYLCSYPHPYVRMLC